MFEFNFDSVLVPTDFSDPAHEAVDHALSKLNE